ncbi:hypothetical protein [Niabella hirudinis]|uniref:hypothetical protein n=1 Tax=Niabella hirudinis TaxID=1285929 RepID=UPI003EC03AC7
MTIRKYTLLLIGVLSMLYVQAQDHRRVEVGYFDLDDKPDSCYYEFNSKTAAGPVYDCKLILSGADRKERSFTIGVSGKSLVISSCGVGCISTYEWITGMQGEEREAVYKYDKKCDDWLLSSRSVNGKSVKLSAGERRLTIGGEQRCRKKEHIKR